MTINQINIFADALGYSESSNDYYNDNGQYWGKYQFGNDRRYDIALLLGIPNPTREEFTPDLQETFFITHINDIENFIYQKKLDNYFGYLVTGKKNGITAKINLYGLVAGAHLGGKEGMRKAVQSGFAYDPNDNPKNPSKGTYISDYVSKFSDIMEKKTAVHSSQGLVS
jgi:hypothetical protein